jgi:integrase
MPTVALTDITIRNLKPVAGKQVTYIDRSLKGFGVRVSGTSAMSYVLTYGAERRRIKLGDVGIISLKDARSKARDVLAEHQLGISKDDDAPTFDEAKALFLSACEQKNKPRTLRDYNRLLTRHFAFGSRKLTDITAQHINRCIDRLQTKVAEQNHALVCIKIFMRWAQRRHYIKQSPCEGMQTIKGRVREERLLSDADIFAIYKTAEEHDSPFTRIIRICILTGLRRSEAAWLRHSYLSGDTLTLPSSLTKNKREFVLPIGPMTKRLFEQMPGDTDFFFPAERGDKVFGGWSKQKALFDKQLAEDGFNVGPWILHSLRKYFASTHAAIGTPIHLTERLLHHVSGSTTGGLIAVYQKHTWLPEMRRAAQNYEEKLAALLEAGEKHAAAEAA